MLEKKESFKYIYLPLFQVSYNFSQYQENYD